MAELGAGRGRAGDRRGRCRRRVSGDVRGAAFAEGVPVRAAVGRDRNPSHAWSAAISDIDDPNAYPNVCDPRSCDCDEVGFTKAGTHVIFNPPPLKDGVYTFAAPPADDTRPHGDA